VTPPPPASPSGTARRAGWPLLLLLAAAGCAETADRDAIRGLPPSASLDARGLERGRAGERPAAVQVRPMPERGVTILTVSPQLQTGSAGSLPIVVSSLGAERTEATGEARVGLLVTISNARGYAGFSRAQSRQDGAFAVQVLRRNTDCSGLEGCLYVESLLVSIPEAALRRVAGTEAALRIRIEGNAAFAEASVPAGHLRALTEALARL